jgi:hypothetical protein
MWTDQFFFGTGLVGTGTGSVAGPRGPGVPLSLGVATPSPSLSATGGFADPSLTSDSVVVLI